MGSTLYQANKARFMPLVTSVLSPLSWKVEGTLDMVHCLGLLRSIYDLASSKSSIYEALSCVPPAVRAISWANSPVNEIYEGSFTCRNGILFNIEVSHWLSCFQFTFSPHMVLLRGSDPIVTFEVCACSCKCINVPPIWKLFEKSYSQFNPNIVLRRVLYSVFDSNDTFTFVPASMMLWFRIVTSPAE